MVIFMNKQQLQELIDEVFKQNEEYVSDYSIAENLHIEYRDVQMIYYFKKMYKDDMDKILEEWNKEH